VIGISKIRGVDDTCRGLDKLILFGAKCLLDELKVA
jgi:hypothetical protein